MAGKCTKFHLKNPFRSISFLLVFCVLVLLVPVNCWNIYSAQQSQAVIINQTRSSIDNLGTIYMKNLEHRKTYMRPLQDYFSDADNLVRKN